MKKAMKSKSSVLAAGAILFLTVVAVASLAHADWASQTSGTTETLEGVHFVDAGVAGTILKRSPPRDFRKMGHLATGGAQQ